MMKLRTVFALAASALLASGLPAAGQEFDHCSAIRMIVPYTAGGSGDVGARLLAPFMADDLGVPVQVENLPGAGSQVGVTELANATPDGCTIGWTHLPAVIAIYSDPSRQAAFSGDSLVPIAMYVVDPGGLAVRGDSPYNSLNDIIDAAKAGEAISMSDSGVMSDGHLLLLELQRQTGADFAIVHGAGGAEGTADLLGGHITAQTINLSGANVEMAASGQIKLLAVFTEEPSPLYPGVATATEQGFPILSSTSRALSAPAGTPPELIDRLSLAVERATQNPEFLSQAEGLGIPLTYMNAADAAAYWDQLEKTFAPIIAEYVASQT